MLSIAKRQHLGVVKLATKREKTDKNGTKQAKPAKANGAPAVGADESGPKWTFLTNHAHVLTVLESDSELVLREVALRVGITERAVQRIIVDLEESGFLERERVGRQNHYRVLKDQPLRHPIESHKCIGDLLTMLTG